MGRNGGLRAVRLRHGDRFVTDVVNDCLSLNRHGTEETPDGPGGSIASKSVQLSFTLANAAAKFFTNVFPESCGGRHLTGVVRDECARVPHDRNERIAIPLWNSVAQRPHLPQTLHSALWIS